MASPVEKLDRSVVEFMRHVPVHIAPILYRAVYRDRVLPESEVMVLVMLADCGPLSPTRISRGLNMQKGSLTSVLRRLEKLDLIARRNNPEDERSYIAELTPVGKSFAKRFYRQRSKGLQELFGSLAPRDCLTASAGLDQLSAHFRELEEREMAQALKDKQKTLNWYHAASPEDRREYDAFGPWLTEVKSEEDMPPRFQAFFAQYKDARFLLKVPKNADRRQLRPGMDLYEAVLAANDDGFGIVRLEEGSVVGHRWSWEDVAAIGCFGDRLTGVWTAYMRDGSRTDLTYNKVSSDQMDRVTDFARERLSHSARVSVKPDLPTPETDIADEDVFFGSALLELRRRDAEDLTPIHFEPQGRNCRDENGNPCVATGLLILASPRELVLVNRDRPSHRLGEAWYASNDIFIPFSRITHFSVIPAPGGEENRFLTLLLRIDGQVIEQPCLDLPEAVIDTLRQRCDHLS